MALAAAIGVKPEVAVIGGARGERTHVIGGRGTGQRQCPEAVGVAVRRAALGDEPGRAGGPALGAHAVQIAPEIVIGRDAQTAVLQGFAQRGGDIELAGTGH